jgi:type II secretory pathway pseudopilin PulG
MDGSDSVAPVGDTPSDTPTSGRWHVASQIGTPPAPDPDRITPPSARTPAPTPLVIVPGPLAEPEPVAEPALEPISSAPVAEMHEPPVEPEPIPSARVASEPLPTVGKIVPSDPAEPGPVASVAEVPLAGPKPARNVRPHRRRTLLVGAIVLAVVLVAIGVAVGAVLRQSAVNDERDRVTAAEQQIRSLQAGSKSQAAKVSALQAELGARDATIAGQRDEIARLQPQQPNTTPSAPTTPTGPPPPTTPSTPTTPTTQPQSPASAESFGDGLYEVGADIQPGQYRTNGSAACYWAKLTSSDTNNVLVNNLSDGPQTVTVDSPFFVSDGCGTWTKVG